MTAAEGRLQPCPVSTDKGQLIVVVGPSGSGKDTLLAWLADRLRQDGGVRFVRRTITRPAEAGGEDHLAVTPGEFAVLERRGEFCISWQAHGLMYGLPTGITDSVTSGATVFVNGSRQALPLIRAVFPRAMVVMLSVEAGELARRLGERGREGADDIRQRLERARLDNEAGGTVHLVDNTGPVAIAGKVVLALAGLLPGDDR